MCVKEQNRMIFHNQCTYFTSYGILQTKMIVRLLSFKKIIISSLSKEISFTKHWISRASGLSTRGQYYPEFDVFFIPMCFTFNFNIYVFDTYLIYSILPFKLYLLVLYYIFTSSFFFCHFCLVHHQHSSAPYHM